MGIGVALAALLFFRSIFLAAMVSLILGILLEPVIRFLQTRLHFPHGISVAVTAFLMLGAVGGFCFAGYSLISDQVQGLAEQGPQIQQRLTEKIDELVRQFSWLGLDKSQFNPGEHLQQAGGAVFKTLTFGLEGLSYVLAVFMLAIFIAGNFRSYGQGCLTLFTPQQRPRVASLSQGCVAVVKKWFFSQVIVVSISAALTAVTMLIIGFDYWLVIAALTLILDFIPFIGAIITGLIAAGLTLGTEPDKLWWVLLAYVVIQQIETDVLLPIVMKGRIRLPEAQLLVFVLVMAAAFGVVGIFLSPPIFAILHYLYVKAYIPWVEQRPQPPA